MVDERARNWTTYPAADLGFCEALDKEFLDKQMGSFTVGSCAPCSCVWGDAENPSFSAAPYLLLSAGGNVADNSFGNSRSDANRTAANAFVGEVLKMFTRGRGIHETIPFTSLASSIALAYIARVRRATGEAPAARAVTDSSSMRLIGCQCRGAYGPRHKISFEVSYEDRRARTAIVAVMLKLAQ